MPLKIVIPGQECYDPVENLFHTTKDTTLTLEHSLVSISKWESIWKIPFMQTKKSLTPMQLESYVKCMTLTQNVDPAVYGLITRSQYEEIVKYISDQMSATTINEKNLPKQGPGHSGRTVTSELVYYWMASLQIPFDPCQKWHFNRLMNLIRIGSIEQQPPKKMSKRDVMSQNKAINAQRRASLHSKG